MIKNKEFPIRYVSGLGVTTCNRNPKSNRGLNTQGFTLLQVKLERRVGMEAAEIHQAPSFLLSVCSVVQNFHPQGHQVIQEDSWSSNHRSSPGGSRKRKRERAGKSVLWLNQLPWDSLPGMLKIHFHFHIFGQNLVMWSHLPAWGG